MATHTASLVKAHLSAVLETMRRAGEPIVITQNGKGAAVLQELASYEAQQRTLTMLKLVAQGERDIARGCTVKQREVFRSARKRQSSR